MHKIKYPILRPHITNYFAKVFKSSQKCADYRDLTRPVIVTIAGANCRAGQIAALLLKQCPFIDELRLFDYAAGPCGIAMDLSHIDTTVPVRAYTGLQMLRHAVEGAKVVAVCGGDATKPAQSEYELFLTNADYVRNIALHAAEFNPKGILCIATPPIAAMVPLASEEYKKAQTYDARRILGMMSLAITRANVIIGEYVNEEPAKIKCPVIGAMGEKTTVAVISQTKVGAKINTPIGEVLRNKIAGAENTVLTVKYIENAGPCTVSTGFALAEFVTSVIKGVLGLFQGVECAFVRQSGNIETFLPYMGSIVKLGKYGVQSVHMPKINNFECSQLQRASTTIQEQIRWGEGYITGATTKKRRCIRTAPLCPVINLKNVKKVGDITFDPNKKESIESGRLVPVGIH